MWVQIRFRPGSFRVSRDTHSEWSHKVRGTVHMITDVEGEVQEVSPEFLEDYMADGAVMGRIVQEAGKDDGFETTYTCFETETTQALQELEHRPARKSVAPRLAGGRSAPKPKMPRQLPLDGGVDSAEDEAEAESHGAGLAELRGAVGKLRVEVRRKSSSGGEGKSKRKDKSKKDRSSSSEGAKRKKDKGKDKSMTRRRSCKGGADSDSRSSSRSRSSSGSSQVNFVAWARKGRNKDVNYENFARLDTA